MPKLMMPESQQSSPAKIRRQRHHSPPEGRKPRRRECLKTGDHGDDPKAAHLAADREQVPTSGSVGGEKVRHAAHQRACPPADETDEDDGSEDDCPVDSGEVHNVVSFVGRSVTRGEPRSPDVRGSLAAVQQICVDAGGTVGDDDGAYGFLIELDGTGAADNGVSVSQISKPPEAGD
jgi:hypothetical protein